MSIRIPKDLAGFTYGRVFPVDIRDFNIDLLLQRLFFRAASEGNDRAKKSNDPSDIDGYIDQLHAHASLDGFNQAERKLLSRLSRTCLIREIGKGTARKSTQIGGITEYSYLSFKPGFPYSDRLRSIDLLLYNMLSDKLGGPPGVQRLFEQVFGQGLKLRRLPEPNGEYDNKSDLDTLSRLSIAFLDGFKPTGVRYVTKEPNRPSCPAHAEQMAEELTRWLLTYHELLPTESLVLHFKALTSFLLFDYSQVVFKAIIELVNCPTIIPAAMNESFHSAPQKVYLDWTTGRSRLSREMAVNCAQRDLASMSAFAVANLTLRLLDRYCQQLRRDTHRYGHIVSESLAGRREGPAYLQTLLNLQDHPQIGPRLDAAAMYDEERIIHENVESSSGSSDIDDLSRRIDLIAEHGRTPVERVARLLVEAQKQRLSSNSAFWFRSAGGLDQPYGILSGSIKSRRTWRYAPENELLAMLVQLAMISGDSSSESAPRPQAIGLPTFLTWLDERFGIVVDRPPDGFTGPDYVAAAHENLQAMLMRLRQMGVFRDLSDDFTVQRLVPPYESTQVAEFRQTVGAVK